MAAGAYISSFVNESIDWSKIPIAHKYLLISIIFNMQFVTLTIGTRESRRIEIEMENELISQVFYFFNGTLFPIEAVFDKIITRHIYAPFSSSWWLS